MHPTASKQEKKSILATIKEKLKQCKELRQDKESASSNNSLTDLEYGIQSTEKLAKKCEEDRREQEKIFVFDPFSLRAFLFALTTLVVFTTLGIVIY